MSNNSGFSKPFLIQVAKKGELEKCPDMLLGRYNGHPGDDLSPDVLAERGADYQWYWYDRAGVSHSGWPLRVRDDRYVAIPNHPKNLEILEKMKAQKWSTSERTESGVVHRTIDAPPLYELVTEEVQQVSVEAIMAALAKMSVKDRSAFLSLATEPEAEPTAEALQAEIAAAEAVLADPEASKADKKEAGAKKRDAEDALTKLG